MGISQFTYAGTLHLIDKDYLLVPKYAVDWVGGDKLHVIESGDYSDFKLDIDSDKNCIDGNSLIGVFLDLYLGEEANIKFEDLLYSNFQYDYKNNKVKDYQANGIFSKGGYSLMPYSIKVVEDENVTYEDCLTYSPCGQNGEKRDTKYASGPSYENALKFYFN